MASTNIITLLKYFKKIETLDLKISKRNISNLEPTYIDKYMNITVSVYKNIKSPYNIVIILTINSTKPRVIIGKCFDQQLLLYFNGRLIESK